MSREDQVLAAADELVDAFAQGRTDAYFAAFAPDATFVFHTTARRLGSVDEYREQWRAWEADDGFRVLACASSDRLVQLLGDEAAIFVHAVETRIATRAGEQTLHEHETIVFRRDAAAGRWLAVHEHLSPAAA